MSKRLIDGTREMHLTTTYEFVILQLLIAFDSITA